MQLSHFQSDDVVIISRKLMACYTHTAFLFLENTSTALSLQHVHPSNEPKQARYVSRSCIRRQQRSQRAELHEQGRHAMPDWVFVRLDEYCRCVLAILAGAHTSAVCCCLRCFAPLLFRLVVTRICSSPLLATRNGRLACGATAWQTDSAIASKARSFLL